MQHPRVLVVDDEPRNVRMARSILAQQGMASIPAHDGKEAFALALKHQLDLVLLDVQMPGIDGIEVCRQLQQNPQSNRSQPNEISVDRFARTSTVAAWRSRAGEWGPVETRSRWGEGCRPSWTLTPQTAKLLVFFVTALNDGKTIERAVAAGANDFLAKPVENDELVLRVRSMLRLHAFEKQLCKHEEQLRAQTHQQQQLCVAIDDGILTPLHAVEHNPSPYFSEGVEVVNVADGGVVAAGPDNSDRGKTNFIFCHQVLAALGGRMCVTSGHVDQYVELCISLPKSDNVDLE